MVNFVRLIPVLLSFLLLAAHFLRAGLLPSEFREDGGGPLYYGADVSLWFVNAAYAYLRASDDEPTVRRHLYDAILKIMESCRHGTGLGIHADAE